MNEIIFEDGLSEYNIKNNIDNQSKYKWLLDIKSKELIIGLDTENNIVFKSGKWIEGSLY